MNFLNSFEVEREPNQNSITFPEYSPKNVILDKRTPEKFNFKLQDLDHLKKYFEEKLTLQTFTDVTLVCEDNKKYRAHQAVLSTCSPFFKKIFTNLTYGNDTTIYLQGLQSSDIEVILHLIYLGEATIDKEKIYEFLKITKYLKISELNGVSPIFESKPEKNRKNQKVVSRETDVVTRQASKDEGEEEENIEAILGEAEINHGPIDTLLLPNMGLLEMHANKNGEKKIRNVKEGQVDPQTPDTSADSHIIDTKIINVDVKSMTSDGLNYFCQQCDFVGRKPKHVEHHMRSAHEGLEYAFQYYCGKCEYKTKSQGNLSNHVKSHHEGLIFLCDKCDYKTRSQGSLYQHVKTYHEGLRFPCSNCEKQFTSKSTLRKHIECRHEGVRKPRLTICDQCEYSAEESTMEIHIQSKHKISFKSSSFDSIDELDQKIYKLMERDSEGKLKCTVCGKISRSKAHSKEHIERHIEDICFLCNYCQHKCKTRAMLRCHYISNHKK